MLQGLAHRSHTCQGFDLILALPSLARAHTQLLCAAWPRQGNLQALLEEKEGQIVKLQKDLDALQPVRVAGVSTEQSAAEHAGCFRRVRELACLSRGLRLAQLQMSVSLASLYS